MKIRDIDSLYKEKKRASFQQREHEYLDTESYLLRDGKIAGVGENLGKADHVIDAKGKLVTPGLIQLKVGPVSCLVTSTLCSEFVSSWAPLAKHTLAFCNISMKEAMMVSTR